MAKPNKSKNKNLSDEDGSNGDDVLADTPETSSPSNDEHEHVSLKEKVGSLFHRGSGKAKKESPQGEINQHSKFDKFKKGTV